MPKFNLNESSLGFLELVSEQNLVNLGVIKDTIVNTMIDSGLKAKVEGLPFRMIVAQLQEQIQDLGRRLSTEAYTGITGFDKSIKSFEYAEAGIKKYVYVGPADAKTRDECLQTLSDPRQGTGWTRDEIAGSGTPFVSTGGYNCRHEWQAFLEDVPAKQLSDKQVGDLKEQRRIRTNLIAQSKDRK